MQELENIIGVTIVWSVSLSENDNDWRGYERNISERIEEMDTGQSYEYTSNHNNQTYKITKLSASTAEQINMNTNSRPKKVQRRRIPNHQ